MKNLLNKKIYILAPLMIAFAFSPVFSGSAFAEANSPYIQTQYASGISSDAAILHGYVTLYGNTDAYVWFEYGMSDGNLQYKTYEQYISNDKYFSSFLQTVNNLTPSTRYYFRAVARNNSGIVYGSVFNFYTISGGNNYPSNNIPFVVAKTPIITGDRTATLNAEVHTGGRSSNVWFEYGPTPALSHMTPFDSVNSSSEYSNFYYGVSDLSPNSTYYVRAKMQNSSGTFTSQTISFNTSGFSGQSDQTNVNENNNQGGSIQPAQKEDSCIILVPSINTEKLSAGDEFVFTVTYKNGCDFMAKDSYIKITLPDGVEFASTNFPVFNKDSNGISYNIGTIDKGFRSYISINGTLKSASADSVVFGAVMNFNDSNDKFNSVDSYLTVPVDNKNILAASIFGILSRLLPGWMIVLLALFVIMILVYFVFIKKRKYIEKNDVLMEDEEEGFDVRPLSIEEDIQKLAIETGGDSN
jgi:hypothetical protein